MAVVVGQAAGLPETLAGRRPAPQRVAATHFLNALYMLLCDDIHADPDKPACTHVECLMSHIVSLEDPPYPFLRETICVFLVLTECRGRGRVQLRVSFIDDFHEVSLFGSLEHEVDFASVSPLDAVGIPFRLRDCRFPSAGRYSVQFWYNGFKVEERPLQLR